VNPQAPEFDAQTLTLRAGPMTLGPLEPLIDSQVARTGAPRVASGENGWTLTWPLESGLAERFVLTIAWQPDRSELRVDASLDGVQPALRVDSIGVRVRAAGATRYLRTGYTSWDGSHFAEFATEPGLTGHAVTALVSADDEVAVLGFLRHDRLQTRFQFAADASAPAVDIETLIDGVAHDGSVRAESLVILAGRDVEEALRGWAQRVARASPLPPRAGPKRIAGWCSWYSLYASISDAVILEHLQAAARFRDRYRVPFEVFQIDDGFVPEMGDWLDVKPQFPRGMAPLLADIRAAGFVPGLWIAPWMVGNRSRLYAEHPDWVVLERETGRPHAPMKFYGEFRWHKRSEEYYVLDVTHPAAERFVRDVFRAWRGWGCGYFKTDFMYFGTDRHPAQLRWHREGLSRIEIWMRMARLIREEIGDATWLGCGGPIWAPVGLVDAVRIGRDVGVTWKGRYSAESLLRDQTARNFANGILWQADPDCILLRNRFHELTDAEVHALVLFAGLAGGVLMTSDQLDEVPEERRALFAQLAGDPAVRPCDFPRLGRGPARDPVLVQRARRPDGSVWVNVLNAGDEPADRTVTWETAGSGADAEVRPLDAVQTWQRTEQGVRVTLPPRTACRFAFSGARRA
jgi:alpha-galactosidase